MNVPTPALLLDLDKLENNLASMAARCRRLGVSLRPHVKTHKCPEIARLQRDQGARGLTVSTLHEAETFAAAGFDDLTWAFPLIPTRVEQATDLASRVSLGLLVDSDEAIDVLESTGRPLRVWLKVDCGYHRAGVDPESDRAPRLARRLADSRSLAFAGLLTHSGHAYRPGPIGDRLAVARQERDVMVGLAERLRAGGLEVPAVSVGSTPAMARIDDLTGVSEARPGNYALYDLTQVELGSCDVADCAVTVLATVVSAAGGPGEGHSVIDAGALALSKDLGPAAPTNSYGRLFADYDRATLADDLHLTSLSQEHGILDRHLPIGRQVRILPNHSCLTVAQFDEFVVLRGDRVVDRWKIHRGRDRS